MFRLVCFLQPEHSKIAVLQRLLDGYAAQLKERYVVVTETRVRWS